MPLYKTYVITQYTVSWGMPDLSAISHSNIPVAENPRVERTWVCTEMLLLCFGLSKSADRDQLILHWANKIDWWATPHSQQRVSCTPWNPIPWAELSVPNLWVINLDLPFKRCYFTFHLCHLFAPSCVIYSQELLSIMLPWWTISVTWATLLSLTAITLSYH